MKTIKVNYLSEIPEKFTGITIFQDGTKWWYKEGKKHREDGPAKEFPNGYKVWYLAGEKQESISLKDYIILDYDKGKYGLMWYRLLDKDKIIEYPDIPGLIVK